MTLRKGLLPRIEAIRKAVRGGLDQCPSKLQIVRRTWSGGQDGLGTPTETVLLDFAQYLPIRQMLDHEVADSGGLYRQDDIMVSRITPFDGVATGFTPQQLQPTVTTNGVEIIYRITGESLTGDYTIIDLRIGGRASHPGGYSGRGGIYSYALILRRRLDSGQPT